MLLNKKKTILDLPDSIDPIVLIENKVTQCPLCKEKTKIKGHGMPQWQHADIYGVRHNILTNKNCFLWKRFPAIWCNCGCTWDTGWYPADHDMFKIVLNNEETLNNILKEYNIQEEKNNE